MSLDKRLKDKIIEASGSHDLYEDGAERIIQAFIDEGWQEPRAKAVNLTFDNGRPEQLMTGPEWLARFEKEMKVGVRSGDLPGVWIAKAARRAAGVDDE